MSFRFQVSATIGRLYNGRRSFYASLHLGSRFWFVSRWDTARVDRKHFDIWRGPVMTWYAGACNPLATTPRY